MAPLYRYVSSLSHPAVFFIQTVIPVLTLFSITVYSMRMFVKVCSSVSLLSVSRVVSTVDGRLKRLR